MLSLNLGVIYKNIFRTLQNDQAANYSGYNNPKYIPMGAGVYNCSSEVTQQLQIEPIMNTTVKMLLPQPIWLKLGFS